MSTNTVSTIFFLPYYPQVYKVTKTDSIGLVETFLTSRGQFKTLVDAITIVDLTLLKKPKKVLVDTLTWADTLSKKYRMVRLEVLSLVESFTKTVLGNIHLLTLVDTLVLAEGDFSRKVKKRLGESITLVEVLNRKTKRSMVETLTLVENFRKKAKPAAFVEALVLSEVFSKKVKIPFGEVLTLTDNTATKLRTLRRAFTETLTLTDITLTKKTKRVMVDSFSWVETLLRKTKKRFSESIPLVETFTVGTRQDVYLKAEDFTSLDIRVSNQTSLDIRPQQR